MILVTHPRPRPRCSQYAKVIWDDPCHAKPNKNEKGAKKLAVFEIYYKFAADFEKNIWDACTARTTGYLTTSES